MRGPCRRRLARLWYSVKAPQRHRCLASGMNALSMVTMRPAYATAPSLRLPSPTGMRRRRPFARARRHDLVDWLLLATAGVLALLVAGGGVIY